MARELKIKVTPVIDKSLQKLMKAIDSTQTLKVNVDLNDGGLGKMLKSLNSISSRTVKVGLDVDGRALNGLATRLSNLTDKKLKVGVDTDDNQVKKTALALENLSNSAKSINRSSIVIDVDASQVPAMATKLQLLGYTINDISKKSIPINLETRNILTAARNLEELGRDINSLNYKEIHPSVDSSEIKRALSDFNEIDDSINDINSKVVSPGIDLEGLNRMSDAVDELSDKILGIAGQAIEPAIDLAEDSLDLYDSQKSFQMQMSAMGMDDKSINNVMKELNEYGAQSKYSVADMLRAYSEFKGAGNEDPMSLIKGMAGLASYGEKPNQALQALIRNLTEGNDTDNIYTKDWREIRKAIGANASQQIRKWFLDNKGIELTTENFSDKMIYNGDFKQAIMDVGNQQNFQDMARQTNTLSSAIENLKESFTVGVIGDMENQGPMAKFTQALVKQVNDFTDAVPLVTDRLSSTLDKVMNLFGKSFHRFNAEDFLNDIFDSLDEFVDHVTPFVKAVGKLTNGGKDLGKFAGDLVKYAAQAKIGTSIFKTVGSIGDFASDFVSLGKNLKGSKNIKGSLGLSLPTINGSVDIPAPNGDVNKKIGLWSKLNNSIRQGALTVSAVAGSMVIMSKSLEEVATVNIPADKLAINSGEIIAAITTMSALYFAISKFGGGIKGDVMQGVGLAVSVGTSILILAKALDEVANTNIPADKLAITAGEIALSITAMSALYFAMSKFGGDLTGDVAKGAVMALGVGASVVLLAKAFKIVANTNIPVDKLSVTVAEVGGAIAVISLLYGIMGKLGGGLTGYITKGALVALGIAGSMVLLAKAFKTIGKIKINIEGVVDNVSTVTLGVAVIGAAFAGLGFALEALAPLEGFIMAGIVSAEVIAGSMLLLSLLFEGIASSAERTTKSLVNTAKNLNALANTEVPSFSSLKNKIDKLTKDMTTIHESTKGIGGEGLWKSIVSSLETLVDAKTAERAMQIFTDFSNYIIGFNNLSFPDVSTVATKITGIKKIITEMDKAFEGIGGGGFWSSLIEKLESGFDVTTADRVIGMFRNIANFATELVHVSIPEMPTRNKKGEQVGTTAFNDKIQSIKEIITTLKKGTDEAFGKSGGLGALVKSILGKWTTNNNAENLDTVLGIFESIIKFSKDVKGIPNKDKVNSAIDSIQEVFNKIGEFDFDEAQKLTKDEKKNIESAIKTINDLSKVVDTVNGLADLPDTETVRQRLETLKSALEQVSNFDFSGINFENIANQEDNIKTFSTFAGKLKNIATSLAEIGNSGMPDNIVDILENLKQGISKAAEIDLSTFQTSNLETAKTFFEGLANIAESIGKMQERADKLSDLESIKTSFTNLKEIINDLTSEDGILAGLKESVEGFEDDGSLKVASDFIAGIYELANNILAIDEIADRFANMNAFNDAITKIGDMFKKDGSLDQLKKNIEDNFKDEIKTDNVTNFVTGLKTIADAILVLDGIGDQFQKMDAFNTGIDAINDIFQNGTAEDPNALSPMLKIKKSIEDNFKDELKTDNAVNFINGITTIANKLLEAEEVLGKVNLETLVANLNKLSGVTKDGKTGKGIFDSLAEIKEQFMSFTGLGGSTSAETEARADLGYNLPQVKTSGNESVLNSDLAKEVTAMVQAFVDVANKLVTLQNIQLDITSIVAKTQVLGNALGYVKGLANQYKDVDGKGLKNADDLVKTAIGIAERLNTIPVLADDVVARITAIKTAIKELNSSGVTLKSDGITSATSAIVELENSLKTMSADMTPIGKSFGTKFVNAFKTELSVDDKGDDVHANKIVNAVRKIINQISALSDDLSLIGKTMADKLADGFDTLAFINKVAEIKGILQGLEGIEVGITPKPKISGKGKKTRREHGGVIPEYHSFGGRVGSRFFKPQGTDNVPAMLTAGEYVLKRSVTSALGKGFLDKLNQMNLNGAFLALANKTGQHIVNNTTNNITQNVDNKASYMNGLADIGRVVRI